MVEEAELYLPVAQHLARASNRLLMNSHGLPATTNDETADNMKTTVKNLRYYFENDQIVGFDNGDQADALFYGGLSAHDLNDDTIKLNLGLEDYWSCSGLIHEAGHRYQMHTDEMDAAASVDSGDGRDFIQTVLREADYPYAVGIFFGGISEATDGTRDDFLLSVEHLQERMSEGELSEEQYRQELDTLYTEAHSMTREEWAQERARHRFENDEVMEALEIPEEGLVEALMTDGIYEYANARLTDVYSEVKNEIQEGDAETAQKETKQEHRAARK